MPSKSPPFPVPNGLQSFWRSNPQALDNHRTTQSLPSEADIVIIGAGFAGATTAYHLLENTKNAPTKPSIVILEAREACSGATGRNGGHCKPDPLVRPAANLAEYGVEAATEAAEFEAKNLAAVKALIEKEKIDCEFVFTRSSDVQLREPVRDKLKAGYDNLVKNGIPTTDDVFYSVGESAEIVSGVNGAKSCYTYTAGHLWPYKLIMHLLSHAVSQGVNLQTHTPVKQVSSSQDSNGRWNVTTSRGIIESKYVIYATNAYTSALLPEYKDRIVPVRGICSRIVTPQGSSPHLPNTYILRWNEGEADYLIPRLDGSIIVGGARADYYSNLENWYDVADDSKLIEPAKKYFDGYMQRNFRGWENSGAYTDRVWTGIMGYSTDLLPHVGAVPDKPGQYILAGFTGHGMPQVLLCAKGVASMIVEGQDFGKSGVPRLYQTTLERLANGRNKILAGLTATEKPVVAKL